MQSPTARLCGRTGPKNMPWPFNGKKTREEAQVSTGMSVQRVRALRGRYSLRSICFACIQVNPARGTRRSKEGVRARAYCAAALIVSAALFGGCDV